MKITLFEQAPYRYLEDGFEQRYESVCTVPYSLADRERVYTSMRDFVDELMVGARSGFDGITVTEHGQSSYDLMPNPDVVAGALAYATEVEGIETAIYPMGRSLGKSREPMRVAEEYAMLDVISGGRLVAGIPVGLGYDAAINNGVPPLQIRDRFNENLELVLRAWEDREPFPWNGRFHQYPIVNIWPRPLQEHVPVWVTGIGNPNTMRQTLQRGFGFNYFGFAGAKLTGKLIFTRFWEQAEQLGVPRNPYRVGHLQTVAIADTDAEAEKVYGRHLEYAFHTGLGAIPPERLAVPGGIDIRGVRALAADPKDFGMYFAMRTATYAQMVDSGVAIVGSAATVREQLLEYCATFGIGNLHVMLGFGSMPTELVRQNIQRFSTDVAPALRELWSDTGHQHHWWPTRLGGAPAEPARTGQAMAQKEAS